MISSFWEKLPLRGVVQNFDGVAVEDGDDRADESMEPRREAYCRRERKEGARGECETVAFIRFEGTVVGHTP